MTERKADRIEEMIRMHVRNKIKKKKKSQKRRNNKKK